MGEPLLSRWRRRAITIPTMLVVTVVAVVGLPVLLPATVVIDLIRLRFRMPTVRVYLFLLQYLVNDSVEILAAPGLWAMGRVTGGLGTDASLARHERLQRWSLHLLARRAEQFLGLQLELTDDDIERLTPGPVVVISRHVSLFDASLPGLLYDRVDFRQRGVIMAEMLSDPGFDLIYGRLGSVFIPRHDGPKAVAAVESIAAGADDRTALVIFPEGRLFRPEVKDRSLARLADADPERARRLDRLRSSLPPRPGGLSALLDAVPTADVVVIDHAGLEPLARLADLLDQVPLTEPIRIRVRRIPRSEIPDGSPPDDVRRTGWLDDLWLDLDAGAGRSAETD